MIHARSSSLWHHADFRKLWLGETISLLGSRITFIALPLTAVLSLHATPAHMGLLGAALSAPYIAVGLFAGVLVDRWPRRPILISTNLARAGVLALIPVAAWLGLLRVEVLYLVAFVEGVLAVFFDVAYMAYVPSLVQRDKIVEGNSKLEASSAVVKIVGPSVGGWLLQYIAAPVVILFDTVSYLVSALLLGMIQTPEEAPNPAASRRRVRRDIMEGLRVVWSHAVLRSLIVGVSAFNLFDNAIYAVYILYLTQDLALQPAAVGFIFAAAGPGSLLGAVLAGRAAHRFGLGHVLVGSLLLSSLGRLVVPFADGATPMIVPILMLAQALLAGGITAFSITAVSLRQAITPDQLQGRVNASARTLAWATLPLGSLLGGFVAGRFDLRAAVLLGALGMLCVPIALLLSPIRKFDT